MEIERKYLIDKTRSHFNHPTFPADGSNKVIFVPNRSSEYAGIRTIISSLTNQKADGP